MGFEVFGIDREKCRECNFCQDTLYCPSPEECVGCGVCFEGCPYGARVRLEDASPRRELVIKINSHDYRVPEKITIKKALEISGFAFGIFPDEGDLRAPCRLGGCYTCLVLADGTPVRACVSPVREGMEINTALPRDYTPLRVIHGPQPHRVGGKATPYHLKARGYIEVAIWAAGCNLRCPQCQNYATTYDGKSKPLTPEDAARIVTFARKSYGVHRMAISGGEPTLNRPWLVRYFRELKILNPDSKARLHLDSNGTILTRDYIDELVMAGVTDIGVEPKGLRAKTFSRITGIEDKNLIRKYQQTQWRAIKHIAENYPDVFLGVGLPYNSAFISLDEVYDFGTKLASIDPEIQLCVLDYFPTFRRKEIRRPNVNEMLKVKEALNDAGLRTVIVQTSKGHIGP